VRRGAKMQSMQENATRASKMTVFPDANDQAMPRRRKSACHMRAFVLRPRQSAAVARHVAIPPLRTPQQRRDRAIRETKTQSVRHQMRKRRCRAQ